MPKAPKRIRQIAARGIRERAKFGRGGTRVGAVRASQLSSGKNVSIKTLKRISSFSRQLQNFKPKKQLPDGGPTAGTIAVRLWGGPEGIAWAKRQLKKIEKK